MSSRACASTSPPGSACRRRGRRWPASRLSPADRPPLREHHPPHVRLLQRRRSLPCRRRRPGGGPVRAAVAAAAAPPAEAPKTAAPAPVAAVAPVARAPAPAPAPPPAPRAPVFPPRLGSLAQAASPGAMSDTGLARMNEELAHNAPAEEGLAAPQPVPPGREPVQPGERVEMARVDADLLDQLLN